MNPAAGRNRHSALYGLVMGLGLLLLGLFLLSQTSIHSAALTEPGFSCLTAGNVTPVTLSLVASGNVTVLPTTVLCNGASVSLNVTTVGNGNGTVSASVPPPTSVYIRNIFPGNLEMEQIATCLSTTCVFSAIDLSVFTQVEEFFIYKILGGGSGYSPPILSYYYEGEPDTTPIGTSVWLDCCSSQWSAPQILSGSTSTEQWATSPQDAQGTASLNSGGSTVDITYYNQYPLTPSFTVTAGVGYEDPQLTYTQYGVTQQVSASSSASSYWADAGTPWSISNVLYGPTSSERWTASSNSVLSGTISQATTVSPMYYQQYLLTVNYTVVGQGSSGYGYPTFYYASLGSANSTTLTTSPGEYWADAGSQWNVTGFLAGNSTTQRWQTDQPTSESVTSGANITVAYYWQYFVTFGYSVVGGGQNYIAPSLNYSQFGVIHPASPGQQAWADVGSNCSYTNPLPGSTSTERWSASQPTPTISSGKVNVTYYHQFSFQASYTIEDGGQGYSSPIFSYTTFGVVNETFLSTLPTTYWLDYNSAWSTRSQLPGSSATERWATMQSVQGTATSPAGTNFTYYNQYALILNYEIALGGSPAPPSLNFTSFGLTNSTGLGMSSAVYWVDGGSSWMAENPLPSQSNPSSERWITNMTTAQTSVSSAFNQTVIYDHQYYLLVQINDPLGGFTPQMTDWYNNGTSVNIAATPNGGWEFVSWSGAGNASYTGPQNNETVSITSPVNETAIFYTGLIIESGSDGSVGYSYGNLSGTQSGIIQPDSKQTIFVLPGTDVNLTETPSSVIYVFHGWSVYANGTNVSTLVDVLYPVSVKASFVLDYVDITVFVIVTAAVVVLSFGAFPVGFGVRGVFLKKRESASQISGKV